MSRIYERIITSVEHYLATAEFLFAGLDLAQVDQQQVQLCSTDAGAPVAVVEFGGVVLRFPMTEGWRTIGVELPPAVLTRQMIEDGYGDGVALEEHRNSGMNPRRDNPKSHEHETRIMWPSCPHWSGYEGFRLSVGKQRVRKNLPVSYEPFMDPAVFHAKRGAVSGPVRASLLPTFAAKVTPVIEAVFPGAEVLFHTVQVEDECVYFFDILWDGELVADGRVDPALTQ